MTYLGGGSDEASLVAVDATGVATSSGGTNSTDFPTTAGAYDTSFTGGDAFVVRLNAAGNALLYATYLGGAGGEGTRIPSPCDATGAATLVGNRLRGLPDDCRGV